ncbi:unnamed protein product [Aphanomyces euteiches]|uniref:EF-hand domain-containing protein n=1 Tax=Aphanomyces euteiches TaxID=100861 RepID=A0A6G0X5W0_9STRA|nr:hypothetical protein Ae201684_008076 [Aphanomyces euteiches]KAH9074589.1 hypothetical protein Ae201684P_022393 [Aphanomyces euteiches]KAH9155995.1 hypothetical protein AeRB84_002059 [Aphanomyces euteiches]
MHHIIRRTLQPALRFSQSRSIHDPAFRRSTAKAIELAIPRELSPSMTRLRWLVMVFPVGVVATKDANRPVQCAGKKEGKEDDLTAFFDRVQSAFQETLDKLPTNLDQVQHQFESWVSGGQAEQISWGFALGACSGYTLKKVSKLGAFAIGLGFVAMQCASYSGYIFVDYGKLQKDIVRLLDLNKDGNVNTKDAKVLYDQVMQVLEYSLPAGSGFGVGFLVGFRAA